MATAQITYLGDLRTEAVHLQSNTAILTDAPTDNQGKGEAFSPTDLVATALGACIITTMGIVARRDDIDLRGSVLEITKVMSTEPPRKIAQIVLKIAIQTPHELDETTKAKYVRIAHTCPVAISLHPDLVQDVTFEWVVVSGH
ncbi:MAG: OsmC family peroxiredoxin [Runella slithyformis]|nr:MAG: OsmC family peroxiredoxin [Runella sp.]TAG20363.1 MAG: OsmC family peroxiredoxin [Cytophagales bacterium]TAG39519.1 MAG: OsmC family peroxiredoxin [Cytophagia bacterium]TAG81123.1 MAG: OsmC family peroxiredoxin [Cytophagales bacterium]TAH16345.1 MAG: OsmC family peroxiredoxin [Runella slithyformis]